MCELRYFCLRSPYPSIDKQNCNRAPQLAIVPSLWLYCPPPFSELRLDPDFAANRSGKSQSIDVAACP